MNKLHGFYSQKQRDHIKNLKLSNFSATSHLSEASVYLNESGEEVVVTDVVSNKTEPAGSWDDYEDRGPVTKYLRPCGEDCSR